MGTCRSCGGTVPSGALYCPTCDTLQPPPEFVSLVRPKTEQPQPQTEPEPPPVPEPRIQPWRPPTDDDAEPGAEQRADVEAMFAAASTRRSGTKRGRGMTIVLLGFAVMSVVGILGLALMMSQVRNAVGGGAGGSELAEASLQLTWQAAQETFAATSSFRGANETTLPDRVNGVRFVAANISSSGARVVSISALPTTFVATAAAGTDGCIFLRSDGQVVEWAVGPERRAPRRHRRRSAGRPTHRASRTLSARSNRARPRRAESRRGRR